MVSESQQMEWSGQFSGVWEQKAFIVLHDTEWKDLWVKEIRQSPPEADLSEYFAAVVFVGNVPTGGYRVEFSEPKIIKRKMHIHYRIIRPGRGQFVIQAFTQPYFIRLYNRTNLPVTLTEGK